jgi:hypothetical protein
MKSNIILSTLVIAMAAVSSSASAEQINQGAPAWGAYLGSDAAYFTRSPVGTYNTSSTPKYASASLDHNPSSSGENIIVGALCSTSATAMTCTVYSTDLQGNYLGSYSQSAQFSGFHEFDLILTVGQSYDYGYESVYCYVPPSCRVLGHMVSAR